MGARNTQDSWQEEKSNEALIIGIRLGFESSRACYFTKNQKEGHAWTTGIFSQVR